MTNIRELKKLKDDITEFVKERDWQPFHSPKNLAMALSVEVSELVEIFQWLSPEESQSPDGARLTHIEEEIGDVMIYLTTIAMQLGLDPIKAAEKKMVKNRIKYPAPEQRPEP
ncbi:MAG: nucleotide pyrophosphohydrolase [Desulfobulbaceae bacterium]|uniref:Nucleotide pyrophosphohydrolase n=1 Tax=Candidatus Desulfatifera sulfidica TaxID=2841691 RepID=A0A8J6TAE0_9BACT|nr:nucleotide pyrophosphohydrolase [Candidatus Desulfatifera sulfidica]